MTVHDIKLSYLFFNDVKTGKKKFELRKDDRHYQVGDVLRLHEIENGMLTGRVIEARIVYKLKDYIGLADGYCVLGIGG